MKLKFNEEKRWALHNKGEIVYIDMWSVDIEPQELHFKIKHLFKANESKWSFVQDFKHFTKTKKQIKRFKRDIRYGKD